MPGFPALDESTPTTSTPPVRETIDWIAAIGTITPFVIEPGPQGRFMPPVGITLSQAVGSAGNRIDQLRHNGRDVLLPIWIEAATQTELRLAVRAWAQRLDPLRGEGGLRVTNIDGQVRDLRCVYTGGLEGDEATERAGPTYFRAVLSFHAADPYWYETEPSQQVFRTVAGVPFFPILPLALSESAVIGRQRIDNNGDVEAWPRWTLKGPFSQVTMTNETTGRTLVLNAELGSGEVVVIDTRPGVKTVTDGAGANRFGEFDDNGSLWSLAPGQNTVTLEAPDASSATEITMFFQRRYLTA